MVIVVLFGVFVVSFFVAPEKTINTLRTFTEAVFAVLDSLADKIRDDE